MGKNKGNGKAFTQRHVCSRMNFLYQASNLMAHNNNNILAAYYGKLCRNVGTKALLHMSPALKRTLCKHCSLPLLPGINTTLRSDSHQRQKQMLLHQQIENHADKEPVGKRRHRRLRRKSNKRHIVSEDHTIQKEVEFIIDVDDRTNWHLECRLCGAHRRYHVDILNECWPERAEAIVRVLQSENQRDKVEVKEGIVTTLKQ